MKISIFSAFFPFRGGIAQFNARLYRELEKNHQVQAYTFKKQYPDLLFPGKTQYVTADDQADPIPATRIVSTFQPFSYFSAAKKIRASKPDVFIANYWISIFAVFLALFAFVIRRKAKSIALIHNLIPHEKRFFDTWMARLFCKQYDGFIVLSDEVKNQLLALQPTAKVLKLDHPWYDHFGPKIPRVDAHNRLGLDPSKKTLLFFGLIRHYKGLDILLDAFHLLGADYQLVIAGEVYADEELYTDLIEQSSGKDRIYFFNKYIPDTAVSDHFSAADVCVLPYRSATQSGITATALHFEVPLIVTNVGGLSEAVKGGELGYVVNEPDPIQLKVGIETYFENTNQNQYIDAIQREKKQNSWSNFAAQLMGFAQNIGANTH
jgi:glycosyltransferase involved in cell wall biosynthesis